MQTRFRPVFVALGSLLFASTSLAQTPEPRPAPKPAPAEAAPPAAADDAEPAPSSSPEVPSESAPAAPRALPTPAPEAERPRLSPLPAFSGAGSETSGAAARSGEPAASGPVNEDTKVFAEDWWSHARPILELHGNFRVRAEMFYRFSLGRRDLPSESLWARPPDSKYMATNGGDYFIGKNCTADEAGSGSTSTAVGDLVDCKNNTQAGANLRFRLNPEIHISDNLRIASQIDLLDNVVLGSTSSGYSVTPASGGGYRSNARNGYEPIGFADQSTNPPTSGVNSLRDSIRVKRVWAEYSTPVGELRFGRMPNHWGLGIVNHAGDGYDDDYQSTIDRLQFVAGIKPLDLYISGAWDFPNEGPTSEAISSPAAQPYDLAQLDDVDQYVLSVVRRKSPEITRLALSRGELVINAGLQLTYRKQLLDASGSGGCTESPGAAPLGCSPDNGISYVRRDAHYYLPDLWVQLLYKQFRFELEAATVQGSIGNPLTDQNKDDRYRLASWGFATELEQRFVENKLRLGFNSGWSEGDADSNSLTPNKSATLGQVGGDHTVSNFRFNPAYRIDLILHRNILTRVQGTYYFRPSLSYDFMREVTGQRLGGAVAAIWSRASQYMQTPGHARDLGIELNGALYFQSKDGALNDDPNRMGGFYARLEYGILFPMKGLSYLSGQLNEVGGSKDASSAQILRLYLGATF